MSCLMMLKPVCYSYAHFRVATSSLNLESLHASSLLKSVSLVWPFDKIWWRFHFVSLISSSWRAYVPCNPSFANLQAISGSDPAHRNGLVLSIHKFAVRVFSDRLKCGVPRESCTIGVFVLASSAGSDSMDSMIRWIAEARRRNVWSKLNHVRPLWGAPK